MNVSRPAPVSSRPQAPRPTNLLSASTAGWYARWKARKESTPVPAAEPARPPQGTAPDALTRWLAGDSGT